MIVQFSTGGRGRTFEDRLAPLERGPETASFTPGSGNFSTWTLVNEPPAIDRLAEAMQKRRIKPEFEVFNASMLYAAISLAERALIKRPLHVQFVLGIRNALPPRRQVLDFLVSELRERPGGRRDRAPPADGEPLVPGDGRSLPDRAGGQHLLRGRTARPEQRRAGGAGRGAVCGVRPPPADAAEARRLLHLPATAA